MTQRAYAVVDAFTDQPLEGNPVAVFADGSGLEGEHMQRTARELNLSETVFLLPVSEGAEADVRVRIFTPKSEMPFAGHPILGTAVLLAAERGLDFVRLETGAGVIRVSVDGQQAEMEQPIPRIEPFPPIDQLLAALGVERAVLPVEAYVNGPRHVMVGLTSEAQVAALAPNLGALEELGQLGVSCFAGGEGRYRTRVFAPGLGVPEDPATGSAAGPLGVHLLRHGRVVPGQPIEIHQGLEIGRPSLLRVRVEGSPERAERVLVGGSAVIVAHGEYRLQ
ncbi:MAG TPA: PhzF family phenazine biosynthesis protein [Solirubrobacteraceae bacterium]|nr:PhzF family phenazine biosynthesis protein [Solirubrobacteraceae bacterium]